MAIWKNVFASLVFSVSVCYFQNCCNASEIWLVELGVVDVDSQEAFSTVSCRVQTDGVEEGIEEVLLFVPNGSQGSGLQWLFEPQLRPGDSLICFLEKGLRVHRAPHSIFELELLSLWGCRYIRRKANEAESTQFLQMRELATFVASFGGDTDIEIRDKLVEGMQNTNPMIVA